jgi:hypothetical protein
VPETGLPKTNAEVVQFLKTFPSLIEKTNDGKGIPLEIELLSLESLSEIFGIQLACSRVLKQIDQAVSAQIELEIDNLVEKKQFLNDLIDDTDRNQKFLNIKHNKYLVELKEKILTSEASFKDKLASVLYDVKSGNKDQREIMSILANHLKSEYSSHGVSSILAQPKCKTIVKKLNFIQSVQNAGLSMIEKSHDDLLLFANLSDKINKEVYIIKTSDQLKEANSTSYEQYWDHFFSLKRGKANTALFYVYDYEIFDQQKEGTMCILHYVKGALFEADCFRKYKPVVRSFESKAIKLANVQKPSHSVPLRVACPNFEKCPKKKMEWSCERCNQTIFHDKELKFYCSCGSSLYKNFEFKCNSNRHSENEFFRFKDLENFKEHLLFCFGNQQ